MKIAVPKETKEKENRVALSPSVVKSLVTAGFECTIQEGAGLSSYFSY
jgi:NAD(P) transhydrogenase subunit alpha